MAKKTGPVAGRRERPRKRAEQQRSIETRAAILDAAIAEFAERGFDGASIRAIADRLGLQHPLITYHYRSKDILWRAAAEHAFSQIRAEWDRSVEEGIDPSPLARLRQEYTTLFRYTVAFPEFHRFMRQKLGDPDQQSAAEMGGRCGPRPASGPVIAPDHRGSEAGSASRRGPDSVSLYDGQPHRHAFGIRSRNAGDQRTVIR
ncbi:AcrR family transcriptional regulator [Bradyrhizobium sp. JR6.1]